MRLHPCSELAILRENTSGEGCPKSQSEMTAGRTSHITWSRFRAHFFFTHSQCVAGVTDCAVQLSFLKSSGVLFRSDPVVTSKAWNVHVRGGYLRRDIRVLRITTEHPRRIKVAKSSATRTCSEVLANLYSFPSRTCSRRFLQPLHVSSTDCVPYAWRKRFETPL